MQNGVKFSETEGALIAHLFGEIDHHSAKEEREGIDAMLFKTRPSRLELDFSGVRFMDSSGIGLIIGRADVCRGIGCAVRITGLSESLKKLVRLAGIEKLECIELE